MKRARRKTAGDGLCSAQGCAGTFLLPNLLPITPPIMWKAKIRINKDFPGREKRRIASTVSR